MPASRDQSTQTLSNKTLDSTCDVSAATGGGGGASLIHQASRSLDNNQIIALPSGVVEVIGTPGTSKLLVLVASVLRLVVVSQYSTGVTTLTNLTLGTTIDWSIYLDEALGNTFWSSNATIRHVSLGPVVLAPSTNIVIGVVNDDGIDLPANLSVFDSTGNFGGGDVGNSLSVAVEFRVYDYTLNKFLTTTESGWNETTRTFS